MITDLGFDNREDRSTNANDNFLASKDNPNDDTRPQGTGGGKSTDRTFDF